MVQPYIRDRSATTNGYREYHRGPFTWLWSRDIQTKGWGVTENPTYQLPHTSYMNELKRDEAHPLWPELIQESFLEFI